MHDDAKAAARDAGIKKIWVSPELVTLDIEETLGGTIPNSSEAFTAGNSGNRGAGS